MTIVSLIDTVNDLLPSGIFCRIVMPTRDIQATGQAIATQRKDSILTCTVATSYEDYNLVGTESL